MGMRNTNGGWGKAARHSRRVKCNKCGGRSIRVYKEEDCGWGKCDCGGLFKPANELAYEGKLERAKKEYEEIMGRCNVGGVSS